MPAVATPLRSLPTLQKLGSTVDPNLDAQAVAKEWFLGFADAMVQPLTLSATSYIISNFDDGIIRSAMTRHHNGRSIWSAGEHGQAEIGISVARERGGHVREEGCAWQTPDRDPRFAGTCRAARHTAATHHGRLGFTKGYPFHFWVTSRTTSTIIKGLDSQIDTEKNNFTASKLLLELRKRRSSNSSNHFFELAVHAAEFLKPRTAQLDYKEFTTSHRHRSPFFGLRLYQLGATFGLLDIIIAVRHMAICTRTLAIELEEI
ncbi:hypothetical protein BKA82DRAFT_4016382 [Pisolithus tinctorius]|nr:hypothetical protein BKA82DRAFT_4016382 [Pisolithus tinctorius]